MSRTIKAVNDYHDYLIKTANLFETSSKFVEISLNFTIDDYISSLDKDRFLDITDFRLRYLYEKKGEKGEKGDIAVKSLPFSFLEFLFCIIERIWYSYSASYPLFPLFLEIFRGNLGGNYGVANSIVVENIHKFLIRDIKPNGEGSIFGNLELYLDEIGVFDARKESIFELYQRFLQKYIVGRELLCDF